MASLEFTTNLRLIDGSARTTVPTPEELPLGYACFGIVNSRASIWGNYDGSVHDLVKEGTYQVEIVQETGQSTTVVMSQKAVTDKLNDKLDKGPIPSEYLPQYVDDVLEYDSKSAFPATGETGKIYIDKSTNLIYRWSGTTYIQVGGGDLNLENGTGDVLIQTTNPDHSFKVMTDGRAKVQSAPVESNDVLRLNEFSVLTQSQVDLLF